MSVTVTWKGKNLQDIQKAAKSVLNDAPRAVGVLAVNHFKQNFSEGGFDGEKWKLRKRDKDPGRAVLVGKGSGHLRNSIRVQSYRSDGVTIVSQEKYSQIHNEGGTINHPGGTSYFVKGKTAIFVKNSTAARYASMHKRLMLKTKPHKIPMPQRKFMGESKVLNSKIVKWIRNRMNKELGN